MRCGFPEKPAENQRELTINAQHWQQLKEIITCALECPADQRESFLAQAGLGTSERQRVEAYLAAYDSDPEFLEGGAELATSPSLVSALVPGDCTGGFRIIHKIGEGGMGEVFEAEQLSPIKRRVALKLLRPGHHGSKGLARFEAERQTLALMSHRNIAQVFGAGKLAGRPYLAMEIVEGLPIVEYCDTHRLSIEARIALFIEVCAGVQHAHQRGIIHRDLKPSNILVCEQDGEPFPKVIDFGISKTTVDGGHRYTESGQWLGTPDYMSPEQATGGAVDTRSDVYSLGVLLYELLTGRLPFDAAGLQRQGLDVLLRTLLEEPPVKPSRFCARDRAAGGGEGRAADAVAARAAARHLAPEGLVRRLAGDLDLIVLRTLEKDADRRYASPHELAQDLKRHLDHVPLLAAAPSTVYTLRKLLRRHRLAFATAALVVLSLVAGVIGTSLGLLRAHQAEREAKAQAEQARAEAERANREAVTATKVTDFMWEVFRASDPTNPSNKAGITLREVLDRGAERVRKELADEPQVQARLMSAIGRTYLSLGKFSSAQTLFEETIELLEQTSGGTPELAYNLHQLGELHTDLDEFETSLSYLRRSLELRQRLLGENNYEVSWVLHDIGRALAGQGKTAESLEMFEKALDLKRGIYGNDHIEVARTLNSVGLRLVELQELERGMPMIEEAVNILERQLGPDHPELAAPLDNLAKAHWELGNLEKAENCQQRALAIDEQALGSDHPNVAISLINLAFLSWESRRDCALTLERVGRAKAIFEQHYRPNHPKLEATLEYLASYEEQCAPGGLG